MAAAWVLNWQYACTAIWVIRYSSSSYMAIKVITHVLLVHHMLPKPHMELYTQVPSVPSIYHPHSQHHHSTQCNVLVLAWCTMLVPIDTVQHTGYGTGRHIITQPSHSVILLY